MRPTAATFLGVLVLLVPALSAGQTTTAGQTTVVAGQTPAEATFLRSREFASQVFGKKMEITTASGFEHDGIVDSVSASGVNLVKGTWVQTVPLDQIVRVARPSYRVRNSSLIGMLAGAAAGIAAMRWCGHSGCFFITAPFVGLGAGLGAAVGGILNSIRGQRDVIFMAGRRAMTVSFMPMVSHTRKSVVLAIGWR